MPAAPEPSGPSAWTLASPAVPGDETASFAASGRTAATWLSLDAERAAAIVRVLRGARGAGIVSHIPSLAVLFPTGVSSADPAVRATFATAADTVRGLYERLFVKLRIPGYELTPGDLEDPSSRRDLLGFLERVTVSAQGSADDEGGDLETPLDPDRIGAIRLALAAAPLGGAQGLGAVAALLPREGDGPGAEAIGTYVALLVREFEASAGFTPVAFAAHALSRRVPELDAARATVVNVLDASSQYSPR
jgi:hypothetical protein